MRKPYQGVLNIISFNRHFYVSSVGVIFLLLIIALNAANPIRFLLLITDLFILIPIFFSLLVSLCIYDLSGLYELNWLTKKENKKPLSIINIHAGFDETSDLLKNKFPEGKLKVLDFYNPQKHTEISIKRARKAYPSNSSTISISTEKIALEDESADIILLIFAAHEIRDGKERTLFFKELKRILKPNGQIIITEHLRDIPNFIAYNIGFLHFYSRNTWLKTFQSAKLELVTKQKINPFISTFTLIKNGNTP